MGIPVFQGGEDVNQAICSALFGEAGQENRWRVSRVDVEKVVDKAMDIAEGGLQWFWDGLLFVERVWAIAL